ncbi:hypothetical protein V5O48_009238 [Marasmius crinis-equi]|uniref:Uncharacterized protein n=1 Tax=Marasmius crinis-equi TaxID=585013 RepID=A0ABR3FBT1_9AGAR
MSVLLAVRTWAVWDKSYSAALVIVMYFVGCWAPAFVLFTRFLKSLPFAESPGQLYGLDFDFRGCFIPGEGNILYVCWSLLTISDLANLVMITIPGVRAFRMGGRSELVKIVYRNGIIYYIVIVAVAVGNIVVNLIFPDMFILMTPLIRDLHSILASRAILSARDVASTGDDR